MITEAIITAVTKLFDVITSPLSNIHINLDITKIEPILKYFRMAFYLIPIQELMPILTIIIALMSYRIIISILKALWGVLPLV